MGTEVIAPLRWNDMVNENRHREYGAYSIRKAYSRHASVAIVILTTLTLFTILLSRVFPPSAIKISLPQHTNDRNFFYVEEVSLKPAFGSSCQTISCL